MILTKRHLNRALLARQKLLDRDEATALEMVHHLAGMQAQIPRPPFVGLWTRLQKFERDDLLRLAQQRKIVRATAMRGTIHLLTTKDFADFRPLLAPMLEKGAQGIFGEPMSGTELEKLHRIGREFFGKASAPFDDFRGVIEQRYPEWNVRAAAYTVRMGIPLVMVPTDVTWGWPGNAGFTLADSWLGAKAPKAQPSLEAMVLRYLAAFGPASHTDAQTWSALRGLKETFEALRPRLAAFRDEKKRELFDLPDAPRPDPDTPAPIRFLPEYDNILLSHADRTRIVADDDRKHVYLKNLQVVGSFLVDGFVEGTWKLEEKQRSATLLLSPFRKLTRSISTDLEQEGMAMLHFLTSDAATREVRLAG